MSELKKVVYLLLTLFSFALLPWLGSLIYYNGEFPETFFRYPPIEASTPDPLNWTIFCLITVVFIIPSLLLYMYPKMFGFKKLVIPRNKFKKRKLPVWFWIGLVLWGITVGLQWTHSSVLLWWLHWSDIPLFWGAILMIDGWVFIRNNGKSLVSRHIHELIGIGLASIPGWMIYEFINFFVENYWYYPYARIMSSQEILMYAIITSSGLMPLAFEWYCLFKTIPSLSTRFSNGPKVVISSKIITILIILSFASMLITGLLPKYMFVTIWVSLPITLAAILDKLGIWSPVKEISKGNWSPVLLFALTYLLEGFILELQNYLSISRDGVSFIESPLYWKYAIPFVDVFHISEMPLLGYAGYLPFGVFCWLWWIVFARIMNIKTVFNSEDPLAIYE
ncbi:hypothetical protein [Saccharicrinis aurantiacus]|uniref:hypothetical protein n=1 Tax=Saccharicrinis aurantiacus TaxID=1849719 RepID=UPI00095010E6|nr:hypothetical protein [Saccharicrinis aurantiacus]